MITIDFTRLKMMLGDLHKTQKKHSNTILEILSVIYNTEKEDEIFRRLGLLEGKSEQHNETITNLQRKMIEIEANAYNSEQQLKNTMEEIKQSYSSNHQQMM